VCATVAGSAPICSSPFAAGTSTVNPEISAGSAVIDGQWYVFAGSNGTPAFTVATDDASGRALPAEHGSIDGYEAALLVVPDDVDAVQILSPTGGGQFAGAGYTRPHATP
jgi:hypothetical protein